MNLLLRLWATAALAQAPDRASIPLPSSNHGLPSFANPEGGTAGLINRLAGSVINLAFGFVATLAVAGVMWGGFLLMRGGDEGAKAGKRAILMSLLGLLLTIMAYTIVQLVIGFNPADDLKPGG